VASGSSQVQSSNSTALCRKVEQATTDPDGSAGWAASPSTDAPLRQQAWTYDGDGRVLNYRDPRGGLTSYDYYPDTSFAGTGPDAVGHTRGDLMRVTNAALHVTQYTLYDKSGHLRQSVDPNNVVSDFVHDARGRLVSATVGGQQTTFDWWPFGEIKRINEGDGSWTFFEYDDAQRLVRVSDNLSNSVTYTLDAQGNRKIEEFKDPAAVLRRQLARGVDPLGRIQSVVGRERAQ
jgi:YD repeat-containing protein